jgi:hypothetical protein
MNRSIVLVGIAIILSGLALAASPIVLTGAEQFDVEQEAGIFLVPVGLLVILIGSVQPNPERTTVGGTFGNPEADLDRPVRPRSGERPRGAFGFSPREPASCRTCGTVTPYDLAVCARCGRARECRGCGRTLEMVEDRTDCPGCHRVEAFCRCARLPSPTPQGTVPPSRRRPG